MSIVFVLLLIGSSATAASDDEVEPSVSSEQETSEQAHPRSAGYGRKQNSYGYGCPVCSYQQSCDSSADMLLYFTAGTLLGLLFSMLQNGGMSSTTPAPAPVMIMMPMTPPPPAMMMGLRSADSSSSGRASTSPSSSPPSSPSLTFKSMVTLITNDIAPLAIDLADVYMKSRERPECARLLLCELMRSSEKDSSFRTSLASGSSAVLSWILLLRDVDPLDPSVDCIALSPSVDCNFVAGTSNKMKKQPIPRYND